MVEVLVGIQLNVMTKATSILGNEKAWEKVNEYLKWQKRIDALKDAQLLDVIEKMDDKIFRKILNLED